MLRIRPAQRKVFQPAPTSEEIDDAGTGRGRLGYVTRLRTHVPHPDNP